MPRPFLLAAILSLLAAPALAGLERHRITIDGSARSYLLYVPQAPAPKAGRRLVLVLHGGGGTARQIMRSTEGRFNDLAETDGTLIAYPDAIDRLWDFGEGAISDGLKAPRDDLKFLRAVIGDVSAGHGVDRTRVFATGISRGGQASYFLACKAPGGVRAIAPVAMGLPAFLTDDCAAMPPTGILAINGTADPLVPYQGGPITLGKRARDVVVSTPGTMAFFAARNRCGAQTRGTRIGSTDRIEWQGCRAPVVLFRVNGGGHTWPGERSVLPARIVGATSRDIDATRRIWDFFARF